MCQGKAQADAEQLAQAQAELRKQQVEAREVGPAPDLQEIQKCMWEEKVVGEEGMLFLPVPPVATCPHIWCPRLATSMAP